MRQCHHVGKCMNILIYKWDIFPYNDIINELKEIPLKKLDIDLQAYPVTDEIRNFTDQMAYISLEEGREERVQNLYVMEYWFWVQKD